jgi:hypothetical protein
LQSIGSKFNRESITLVECIATDGWIGSPLLLFPGHIYLEDWYEQGLPEDYMIGVLEKGWITDQLAFDWLQRFNKATKNRACNGYCLLLMDNHRSHLTIDFIKYYIANKILPYCFPPHLTHML